ncbi:MAG: nucleotidyl transferase AbiEii/AbiGii toxin family protein, partial [Candidatus Methanomethylophilaceae archaeon]|nr:nucleotidyl transferase AbiEii/AbiGii toxin family protein [Candidatus Methanomethylophilaceae archaeon]
MNILSTIEKEPTTEPDVALNTAREIIQEAILSGLDRSNFFGHAAFQGGTSLRIFHGLDRFSEDLDFDCKGRSENEFRQMSDELVKYLQLQGLNAELRNKENARLTAFRSNVHFPELLFDLQLTGHREERFLMKLEAQDQGVDYPREMAIVQRNGFSFPVPVPPLSV